MHTHAVQRDPITWGSDADEYKPERRLEGDGGKTQQRRAWEYLPFSGGLRICPAAARMGIHLAFIVAVLAWEFVEVQERDAVGGSVKEHRVTMHSREGVKVRLTRG